MATSIAEAARAAGAMENVATSLAETAASAAANTQIVREMNERQRNFAAMQFRAYVSVRFNAIVVQDNTTNYRFEVRLTLANTGHTPAHDVYHQAVVDILPNPLPDDFTFPIPRTAITTGGVVGPQQTFVVSAALDRMCTQDEITAISTGTINYRDTFGDNHYTNFFSGSNGCAAADSNRHNDAN